MICNLTVFTSSITEQMCLTHWVMACGVPEMVTALSVESGSMSPATWTWAPVVLMLAHIGIKKIKKKHFQLFSSFKQPQIIPNTVWHAESSCKPNRNVCSNIWRGAHKYCPFRVRMQAADLSRHNQRDFQEQQPSKKKRHQHLLKKEINKGSLTEVFGTWRSRTPKKIFSPWVLKNKFLF